VVVQKIDINSIAVLPSKCDAPVMCHRDSIFAAPISLQGVKVEALYVHFADG
jgi:hypothetical protein